jgi:hypothetical protein
VRQTHVVHVFGDSCTPADVRFWQQNGRFRTPEMDSERTWPQLMCCALVTPGGPNFRRTR